MTIERIERPESNIVINMDHYNARKKQMSMMLFCNTYIPNKITHIPKSIPNKITHIPKSIPSSIPKSTTNETRTQRKN